MIISSQERRILFLCSLLLILLVNTFAFSPQISNDSTSNSRRSDITDNIIDKEFDNLLSADYSSNYNGTGKNINITLHQAILNTSTVSFSNLDTQNSFTEPFPNFSGYNTSFVNISIDNIYAPNKTLIVEGDLGTYAEEPDRIYTSFEVQGKGYIENISVNMYHSGSGNGNLVDIYLVEAEDDNSELKPLETNSVQIYNDLNISATSPNWFTATNIHQPFDALDTENNTYFLWVEYSGLGSCWWSAPYDDQNPDTDPESIVLDNNEDEILVGGLHPIDLSLKIDVAPLNNIPEPSEIGLKINDINVENITSGEGNWNPSKSYNSTTNEIEFEITADWWDVSCDINEVQINYTKADLTAISTFDVLYSSQDILWNVTRSGGLNYFDSRLNNYTINFTIPSTWNDIEVWNGNTNKTNNIVSDPIGNGYTKIQILNAGNGTFWFLNATSNNLLSSIDIYKNTYIVTVANYSDTVSFIAKFSTKINTSSTALANLSVYSPLEISNYLNYTKVNSSAIDKSNINFDAWNIGVSKNVTEYGIFRVQAFWNNGTAAAFNETYLTIFGETEIQTNKLELKSSFYVDETFNITVLFNDTGQNQRIDGAKINYTLNGIIWRYDNVSYLGNGEYNITIHCNDSQFVGYGPRSIILNISKDFYNNQSEIFNFSIYATTMLQKLFTGGTTNFNSNEVFNITIQYNDTNFNNGIFPADINYTLNGTTWRYNNIKYIDEGKYNITVYCNDTNFNGYGTFTIIINASRQYYQNHSISLEPITITGNTTLNINYPSDEAIFYSTELFNITVSFQDSYRGNQGIDGATIGVDVDGSDYLSPTITTLENGQYNITLNGGHSLFSNYDLFTIQINANKTNYENATNTIDIYIIGNTTFSVQYPPMDTYYGPTGTFNITVFYNDIEKSEGVNNALIQYSIEGNDFRSDHVFPIDNGQYNITIDIQDSNFTIYGPQDIVISANRTYYYNTTAKYHFNRETSTTIIPGININLGTWTRGDTRPFIFNYSQTSGKPIKGADIEVISNLGNFDEDITEVGNGNYSVILNSTFVQSNTWTYIFNISATGNATKVITLTITILLPNTAIEGLTNNLIDINVVPLDYNLTLNFNFTDAYKGKPITIIKTENVSITSGIWDWFEVVNGTYGDYGHFANGGWLLIHNGNGNYTLIISTYGLTQGNLYSITIRIDYTSPNPGPYNYSQLIIGFYYGSKAAGDDDDGDNGGGGGGTTVMGISPETLMVYIILFTVGAIVVGGSVAAYKKVVVPKKREKERILREVTTIFDDAINLEHILVIHKTTGTCIYFKSFGVEKIDPQLISGFLTAVSSFGREMDSQESLNEITYGDKMLLLADGEHVRITLVLEKAASILLRQHLKKFIEIFEKKFGIQLPKWRGQIDMFKDTGDIVDEVLNTSIILPHEVNYDLAKAKTLENPHSRSVLKIANSLIEGSDRKFFFISTLLIEATDKTGKDKAEIFMGIKELRDTKIITPIQISKIEEKPVSKQELDLINRRLCELPGISDEERQKLLIDLSKMSPSEREAFLVSCQEGKEIVSAPIKSVAGTTVIENIKSAKKEVNNLVKQAQAEIKKNNIDKGIEIYQNAAVIAANWDLTMVVGKIQDTIRIIRIQYLKEKMRILESEGRKAAKAEEYSIAADKYKKASEAASEIFKLGITEMTKEVKRLTNKAKEYGKLS